MPGSPPSPADSGLVDPAFWTGKSVLVTGNTGFKGAWLALWLSSLGADVTGLADGIPTQPSLWQLADGETTVRTIGADVRNAAAVHAAVADVQPDVVLHLAAQPLVRRSYSEPAETLAINALGTAHVLDAVRAVGGVAAVVVVTSDKCYLPTGGEWGHREDEPLGGHDPYSASKACTEIVADAYRRSFGLPLATARAGNVIGGGDWGADRLLPDVLRAASAGTPVALRNPHAVRPWQHVLNPLAGYLLLAQALASDPSGFAGGWNFGPSVEDALPVRALVERIGVLWGGDGVPEAAQEGEHPPETATLRLDSTRARLRLGWRPAWELEEGLRAIVEWHRAYDRGADVRTITLAQIAAYEAAAQRRVKIG